MDMRSMAFVIPALMALLVLAGPVQACAGADSGHVYVSDSMTIEPDDHYAKSFIVKNDDDYIGVDYDGYGDVILMEDDEYPKYIAGEEYTYILRYNETYESMDWVRLDDGRYWVVVENDQPEPVDSDIYVGNAMLEDGKCGAEPYPTPFNAPGFDFGLGIATMLVGAVLFVALGLNRRTN